MPQSYDFIIKPARDFREKFLKKLEIAFFMWQDKSLYATMNRWRIDPWLYDDIRNLPGIKPK